MSVLCPDGHRSQATDYCDVCGAPIAHAPVVPTAPPTSASTATSTGASTGAATACPHCGSPAAAGALFCENCGYDFTTGATPSPIPPGAPVAVPVEPTTGAVPAVVAAGAPATPDPDGVAPGAAAPPRAAAEDPAPGVPQEASALPTPTIPGGEVWVAEVWVDPDWYALQTPEDPLPSVGLPQLVTLRTRSALVGRPSVSRNIHPQVDCGSDSGVSRRHCQLSTDGQRWWVEDLQSSNGTHVARVGDPLPTTPIPPGQRVELQDGDRVYVGAWTRIVVREALPGEV